MKTNDSFWLSSKDAVDRIRKEDIDMLRLSTYGNLTFEVYKPKGTDRRQPHEKDEIYMVISGKGILNCNNKQTNCSQGDILFVPAGQPHYFENYSTDFCTWAVFSTPMHKEELIM